MRCYGLVKAMSLALAGPYNYMWIYICWFGGWGRYGSVMDKSTVCWPMQDWPGTYPVTYQTSEL